MAITWDPTKERTLRKQRGIEIREVADLIVEGKYSAILENPSRPSQFIFVLSYHGYTHAAPFVLDKNDTIVLKTAFPSRKFHKMYGEGHEEKA